MTYEEHLSNSLSLDPNIRKVYPAVEENRKGIDRGDGVFWKSLKNKNA